MIREAVGSFIGSRTNIPRRIGDTYCGLYGIGCEQIGNTHFGSEGIAADLGGIYMSVHGECDYRRAIDLSRDDAGYRDLACRCLICTDGIVASNRSELDPHTGRCGIGNRDIRAATVRTGGTASGKARQRSQTCQAGQCAHPHPGGGRHQSEIGFHAIAHLLRGNRTIGQRLVAQELAVFRHAGETVFRIGIVVFQGHRAICIASRNLQVFANAFDAELFRGQTGRRIDELVACPRLCGNDQRLAGLNSFFDDARCRLDYHLQCLRHFINSLFNY